METLAHLIRLKERYVRQPVRLSAEALRSMGRRRDGQDVAGTKSSNDNGQDQRPGDGVA
jgi:hypothetical protein